MNSELQKSLQVTSLPTTLDSYMFVILLIMIAAGIFGGLTVLKNLGIIETRINEKIILHCFVSIRGKQLLGDILYGLEDR